ncbi:MAG: TRAP transporter small permease [Kiloniellales bacterium]|nr:TRAP transporter small permease [Kiloniellales bacterium]
MPDPENLEMPAPDEGAGMRPVNAVAILLSLIACLFLFGMMVLTFADVIGRYLFLSPLPAAYEIVSLIMPAIIFFALPLTILRNIHVTVDLLDSFVPGWLVRYQGIVTNAVGAIALGLVSWRLWIRSEDQYEYQEVTDELVLDLWPFSAAMSVLCAVAVLAFVANIARLAIQRGDGGASR